MAVPIWPRARRFGNMYAFATVDWLYAVLWFAAWVAVATYVAEGPSDTSNDKDKDKDKSTGCGSESKCHLSTATVILGVVVLYVHSNPACHLHWRPGLHAWVGDGTCILILV